MIPCGNPNEITPWGFGSETPRPSSEATKTPSWRISPNIVPIRHGYRSILDSRHLQLRILCPAAYLSSSNGSHTNFYLFFVSHQMTRTALTTGETKFPECRWLPRVPKIGHSGKRIFPECCTRGRIALGEERLSRVPQRTWHSVKSSTRQRHYSPSATLGEDRHSAMKHATWRFTPPTPLKLKKTKILPRVSEKALGEEALSRVSEQDTRGRDCLPRVPCPGTRERASSPSDREGIRGRIFVFFVFLPHFFVRPSHIV